MLRLTSIVTPVAHLVGPGKIKVVNGRLAFATREASPVRLDPKALRLVYYYGSVGVTDDAMTELFRNNIETAWFTPNARRCRGRLVRSDPSTTALRLLQHRVLGHPKGQLDLARSWVALKIDSQTVAARHAQRHGTAAAAATLQDLNQARDNLERAADVASIRGIEGSSSASWFRLLPHLLRSPWTFERRSRRPPADPVNALLSLGYTLLNARAVAACDAAGLEVYLGALHQFRPGRPSLACDLIEPLRVPAVDRWAIHCLNRGILKPADFSPLNGGIRLLPDAFQITLQSWESEWLNGGHEARLGRLVQELIAWIRQQSESLAPDLANSAPDV